MKCLLLVTTDKGQEIAGTITLTNGKVTAVPEKGFENAVNSVMSEPNYDIDHFVSLKDDPVGWLNALPKQYNGSYFRALLVDDTRAEDCTKAGTLRLQ
jgi:hypothetical protein